MEHDQIIFFRNLFFRAFIIGVALALFYFVVTCVFWGSMTPLVARFFRVDEKEFGRLALQFFLNLRLLLTFLFLVPALALHWTSRKK